MLNVNVVWIYVCTILHIPFFFHCVCNLCDCAIRLCELLNVLGFRQRKRCICIYMLYTHPLNEIVWLNFIYIWERESERGLRRKRKKVVEQSIFIYFLLSLMKKQNDNNEADADNNSSRSQHIFLYLHWKLRANILNILYEKNSRLTRNLWNLKLDGINIWYVTQCCCCFFLMARKPTWKMSYSILLYAIL